MAKIIVVTSGKGGVGKTTTSAAISMGFALRGYKTVVIDFDVGLRNLDLVMGCENRIVYDFIDVISGGKKLNQALIKDKRNENLYILPASQTKDKDALTDEGVAMVMEELSQKFDFIICDSPAGIERGAFLAMYHADEAIIVTNPEVSSIRDSDRIVGMLNSRSKQAEEGGEVRQHLVITRYMPDRAMEGEMLAYNTITDDILHLELLGVVPESPAVLTASNEGTPVILTDSDAGRAYEDIVARFLGEERPLRYIDVPKTEVAVVETKPEQKKMTFRSLWRKIFGGE